MVQRCGSPCPHNSHEVAINSTNRSSFSGIWLVRLGATLSMIFWGASFVWFKTALSAFEPFTVVLSRLFIAGILLNLAGILFRLGETIRREDSGRFLLMALCEPFLYYIGEGYGLTHTSATLGSIIIATIPLITPFFSRLIHKERITFGLLTGLFTSFAGATIITTQEWDGTGTIKGVAFLGLAVFSAIGYGFLVHDLGRRYTPFTIVRLQSSIACFFFLPLFFWHDWSGLAVRVSNMEGWIAVFKLAIFASILAYILLNWSIQRLGITRTNAFTNLIPVFTAIFAQFILGESLGWQRIAGIGLAIGGLFLAQHFAVKPESCDNYPSS